MKRIPIWSFVIAVVLAFGCEDSHKSTTGDEHAHQENPKESHDEHEHGEEQNHDKHDHAANKEETHDGHDHGSDDDHGDEETKEQVVKISAEALKRSGIQTATVNAGVLAGSVEIPAEVQLNPDKVAHVSPLVNGQLLSVDVALGDSVEVDAPLAKLRSIDLGRARAELSRTTSLRKAAEQNRNRQRRLRDEGISSQRSLLEAELAYTQANTERSAALSQLQVFGLRGGSGPDMTLQSPIAGTIVQRHATNGENVSPEDTLFVIADLSRVWVIGHVYEQQIAQVAKGMSATLTLAAYPGRSWTGTVDFVGATLNEETRTSPIRVEIDNPEGALKPGLFGSLRLASDAKTGTTVVVPIGAVQTIDNRSVVFVPTGNENEFAAHPVTVGRETNRQAEILEGIDPGSEIVVDGAFILKSEVIRGELGHGHAH